MRATRAVADDGVILIALLWILTILAVITLSFSRETFVEAAAARNERDLTDAYYIARAGIESTVYQIYVKIFLAQMQPAAMQTQQSDAIDMGKVTGQFGDGEYVVDVQDEMGKININYASPEQIKALLAATGIQSPDMDTIADSIVDWRDPDNMALPNGAENDYYQGLQPPYLARNGALTFLEELLLVRGVTPEYYFGHREKTPDGQIIDRFGISRYFTVYTNRNSINVNYASLPVLLSIPGMPPELAQKIFERARQSPFQTMEDLSKEVGQGLSVIALLTTQRGTIFSLTAHAHRSGSKAMRVIRAIVSMDPREVTKHRVLSWNENIPN
jgi:general secretion pathway protein K